MKKRITVTIDDAICNAMQDTYDLTGKNLSKTVELLLSIGINKIADMKQINNEYEIMTYLLTQNSICRNRKMP